MARLLTTKQITDLNNMNVASQRAGGLGTLIAGVSSVPASGSLYAMTTARYRTTPVIGTAVYVHAAIAMTAIAQTVTTGITSPDVPRIVTIKGNASGITGNVVISGTDIQDTAISDTIALNGSSEVLGVKAFKTVTSIVLPAEVHAGTDTTSIGIGNKIGYPAVLVDSTMALLQLFDNAADVGTVTEGATVALCVYAPAGTLNGVKYLDLVYIG